MSILVPSESESKKKQLKPFRGVPNVYGDHDSSNRFQHTASQLQSKPQQQVLIVLREISSGAGAELPPLSESRLPEKSNETRSERVALLHSILSTLTFPQPSNRFRFRLSLNGSSKVQHTRRMPHFGRGS